MLLKYSALTLQAISRRRTAIGQLSQAFEFILILLLVDIYIHICLLGFSECAIGYLMQKVASPLTTKHLVSPELTALKEHDQQYNTPYFETLRQYLLLERDIPKTAEMLIIHRSTLLYRLKKIQSIINLDLDDPWQRLQLMLSLWILEKEEKGTS